MTRLGVGILTPSYPGVTGEGGIGTYTGQLAVGLTARGHRVHVLTPADTPGAVACDGVTVHRISCRHIRGLDRLIPGAGAMLRVARAARRLAAEYHLDLFEFPNWEGLGAFYCGTRRVPVVVRLHTSSLEAQRIDGGSPTRAARWDVRRERWLGRRADTLVTHSDAHRREMAEELGVEEARIRVVPHGITVHPDFVRPEPTGDDLTVVYLGRLEKRKGTPDLLDAIPPVLREVPRARFVLIGADRPHCPGGRTHADYLADMLPADLRARVRLLGRLPDADVDGWLQRADLFVAPSRYESFGLVFLEAMRWGTPVIGTTAGGIPEVVEDGASGLLVPPARPAKLAEAIVDLLHDRDRRRQLGLAGRRRAEALFSTDRMARDVEALYRHTLEAWRRGRRS